MPTLVMASSWAEADEWYQMVEDFLDNIGAVGACVGFIGGVIVAACYGLTGRDRGDSFTQKGLLLGGVIGAVGGGKGKRISGAAAGAIFGGIAGMFFDFIHVLFSPGVFVAALGGLVGYIMFGLLIVTLLILLILLVPCVSVLLPTVVLVWPAAKLYGLIRHLVRVLLSCSRRKEISHTSVPSDYMGSV